MKKKTKLILLIAGAVLVIIAGAGIAYSLPMFSMTPAETGRVSDTNIYAVRNKNGSLFLIETSGDYIMIDAGSDPNDLKESLDELRINPNDVKWIFLTHSDYDHVGGLALFPNTQIFMGDGEIQLLNGTTKRSPFGGNKLPSGIDLDKITLLRSGQEQSFGNTKIKPISAPGHTPGSTVYLVNDRYLFTGDAFRYKNGNFTVHPFTMNSSLSKKTIEQIKDIVSSSQIVFTSHYGIIKK